MYYWLKRLIIGCNHEYKVIHNLITHDIFTSKAVIVSKCLKCNKVKKDVVGKNTY